MQPGPRPGAQDPGEGADKGPEQGGQQWQWGRDQGGEGGRGQCEDVRGEGQPAGEGQARDQWGGGGGPEAGAWPRASAQPRHERRGGDRRVWEGGASPGGPGPHQLQRDGGQAQGAHAQAEGGAAQALQGAAVAGHPQCPRQVQTRGLQSPAAGVVPTATHHCHPGPGAGNTGLWLAADW